MPITPLAQAFLKGLRHKSLRQSIREDKALREHLSEDKIDKMIRDSFPASDPPSTY